MSETVMMAANRYRLRSLAAQGQRGAELALDLLGKTDRLLGVILLATATWILLSRVQHRLVLAGENGTNRHNDSPSCVKIS